MSAGRRATCPVLAAAVLVAPGCGSGEAATPFDPAFDAAPPPGGPDAGDAGPDADPTLGGPCQTDAECSDGVPCTIDRCDPDLSRCRFSPDDKYCQDQDGRYCNGAERCQPGLGCKAGPPVTCADDNSCTIDSCVEETKSCHYDPRDADGDGDPDAHCVPKRDCDDADPTVSSLHAEVCANGKDDDCDGKVDEPDCKAPGHDACTDPLWIAADGTYALYTAAAKADYSATCALKAATVRDVVAGIKVPPGPPVDVDVVAETNTGQVAIAIAEECGKASTEIACMASVAAPSGAQVARVRGRSLAPGNHVLYVFTDQDADVVLHVAYLPVSPKPSNETCGTAAPIQPGVPTTAAVIDPAKDLPSACKIPMGDLAYSFSLGEPRDVRVYATSIDGWGLPMVSLRTAACALLGDEVTCKTAKTPKLFRRAAPAGTWLVGVSATGPTVASVTVELAPPTAPPADETCAGAPAIPANQTVDVSLFDHTDDVQIGCSAGDPDAAYAISLPVASDVLLVERISQSDVGTVHLAKPACAGKSDDLVCESSGLSPVHASARNVPPGDYRVVAEAALGNPVQLTAFVRKTVPPTLVAFADVCASAVPVPPDGGFFQGNTANAQADYSAGCDTGNAAPAGAGDQMLKLVLALTRRVILDMSGSLYTTVLDVRKGPSCPGQEVPQGCTVGWTKGKSFLDLVLPAGTYYLQVDGYGGEEGEWFLDVRVVDP